MTHASSAPQPPEADPARPISHPSIQLRSGDKAGRKQLRYAVILDSEAMTEWQIAVVENLVASGNAKLVGFILPERDKEPGRFSFLEFFRNFLFYVARMTIWKPRSFRHHPLPKHWAVLGKIRCRVERKGKWSDYFAEDDLKRLKELDLDFILKFGLRILRGPVLKVPRYGAWSFHHGDERQVRGRPAGFWEIYHGWPTTGVILQRLNERLDGGVILKRGVFATNPLSYPGNLERIFAGGADFPALVCSDILRGNAAYLDAPASSTTAQILKNPTNLQMVICLARMAWARIRRAWYGAFRLKVWGIGLIEGPVGSVLASGAAPKVRWLTSATPNVFVADPFLVAGSDRRTWLFYEHLNYETLKGRIGCVELGREPVDVDAHAALVDAHHLSFPCVFRHEGAIYCVPEEARSGRVRLFRFDEDRKVLTEEATLLSGIKAIDPAVFQHGGLWWIAATDADLGVERLMLWHSKDLKGPYTPHVGNPVKIDARHSRAAGRPFEWQGRTYRPAQDASDGYGKRIHVQEILRLDPAGFEERTESTLAPFDPSFPGGLHQLSTTGDWTVVDGYREIIHPLAWYYRLKSVITQVGAVSGRKKIQVKPAVSAP